MDIELYKWDIAISRWRGEASEEKQLNFMRYFGILFLVLERTGG